MFLAKVLLSFFEYIWINGVKIISSCWNLSGISKLSSFESLQILDVNHFHNVKNPNFSLIYIKSKENEHNFRLVLFVVVWFRSIYRYIPALISNPMLSKVWDGITYLFPNCKGWSLEMDK